MGGICREFQCIILGTFITPYGRMITVMHDLETPSMTRARGIGETRSTGEPKESTQRLQEHSSALRLWRTRLQR